MIATVSWTKSGGHAVSAVELIHLEVPRGDDHDDLLTESLGRQVDFIKTLHGFHGVTFAIRYLSEVDAPQPSLRRVRVALLIKTNAKTPLAAKRAVSRAADDVHHLLQSFLPECEWRVIDNDAALESLFRPFSFDAVSVASLTRRDDLVPLLEQPIRPSLEPVRAPRALASESVYFVHPFVPRPTNMGRFLRAILHANSPILYQVTLTPTALTGQERVKIVEEISTCDQVRQRIEAESNTVERKGYEARRAAALSEGLVEQLLRLQDSPFQMEIMIASPEELPTGIIQAAGAEITQPVQSRLTAGTKGVSAAEMQSGGFSVVQNKKRNISADAGLGSLSFPSGKVPDGLSRLRTLVDCGEAAGAFRFPSVDLDDRLAPGIKCVRARSRELPRTIALLSLDPPGESLRIGVNIHQGRSQDVVLSQRDRLQHTYVVGQTGTGKSTLLKSMIASDIEAGRGLALLDPHGDLFREILELIPKRRWNDVIVIDPTNRDAAVGLNLLECREESERHFIVREMRAIMETLLEGQYSYKTSEYAGPVFFQHMQMNLLLAMSNPDDPGTLLEFYEIFQHKAYWRRWMPLKSSDPMLSRWVETTLPNLDYTKRSSDQSATWGEYLSSKFEDFVFDPALRAIFGQKRSTINLSRAMDEGKILLLNLAKGDMSETNSRFLGMAFLAKLQACALRRSKKSGNARRPFFVYVDEFQSFASTSFITLLSEARKFGIGLILANQFVSQLENKRIVQSIFGNVGTHVSFRVGREDAEILEPLFRPDFDRHDLANLPNWTASVRTAGKGQLAPPFSLQTRLPELGAIRGAADAVMKRSQAKNARPRSEIDAEISRSLAGTTAADPVSRFVAERKSNAVALQEKYSKMLSAKEGKDVGTIVSEWDRVTDSIGATISRIRKMLESGQPKPDIEVAIRELGDFRKQQASHAAKLILPDDAGFSIPELLDALRLLIHEKFLMGLFVRKGLAAEVTEPAKKQDQAS